MAYLPNLFFLSLLIVSLYVFFRNLKKIKRNIGLGKDVNRNNNSNARLKNMLRVAFGQSKMGSRPVVAVLHFIVYVGFILINQINLPVPIKQIEKILPNENFKTIK